LITSDRLGADVPGSAGPVFDHDRLSPFPRQPFGEDARHHIGGPAGGKRHDDLHRPRRIVLRTDTRQRCQHGGKRKGGADAAAREMPARTTDTAETHLSVLLAHTSLMI
jgi:hypothetical protein